MTLGAAPYVPRAGTLLAPIALVMAAGLICIGMASTLLISTLAAALVGAGAGLAGSLVGSLVHTQSDPDLVSRVVSLATLASLGLSPIALASTGALAAVAGPCAPFVIGGLIAASSALIVLV